MKKFFSFNVCLLIMLKAALCVAATDLDYFSTHQLGILECRIKRMQCLAVEAGTDTANHKALNAAYLDELSHLDTASLFSNLVNSSLCTQTQAQNINIMCQNHRVTIRRMMAKKGAEDFCRSILEKKEFDTNSRYALILNAMQHYSARAFSDSMSDEERSMFDCALQTCKKFLFEHFSDLLTDAQKSNLLSLNVATLESAMSALKELDSRYFISTFPRSKL